MDNAEQRGDLEQRTEVYPYELKDFIPGIGLIPYMIRSCKNDYDERDTYGVIMIMGVYHSQVIIGACDLARYLMN